MILSIVMPFHTQGMLLDRALQSIYSQLTPDVELILVGDGISDAVAINMQQTLSYASIYTIPKTGANAARSEGVKKANGTYILFIDSDDQLPSKSLDQYLNIIARCSPDLILANTQKIQDDGTHEVMYNFLLTNELRQKDSLTINELYHFPILINKCFKKNLLQTPFLPESALFQDAYLCAALFKNAKKIYYTNQILYHYYLRQNSTSRKIAYTKDSFHSVEQLIQQIAELYSIPTTSIEQRFSCIFILRLYYTLILRSFSLHEFTFSNQLRHTFKKHHYSYNLKLFHPKIILIKIILSNFFVFKLFFYIKTKKYS